MPKPTAPDAAPTTRAREFSTPLVVPRGRHHTGDGQAGGSPIGQERAGAGADAQARTGANRTGHSTAEHSATGAIDPAVGTEPRP